MNQDTPAASNQDNNPRETQVRDDTNEMSFDVLHEDIPHVSVHSQEDRSHASEHMQEDPQRISEHSRHSIRLPPRTSGQLLEVIKMVPEGGASFCKQYQDAQDANDRVKQGQITTEVIRKCNAFGELLDKSEHSFMDDGGSIIPSIEARKIVKKKLRETSAGDRPRHRRPQSQVGIQSAQSFASTATSSVSVQSIVPNHGESKAAADNSCSQRLAILEFLTSTTAQDSDDALAVAFVQCQLAWLFGPALTDLFDFVTTELACPATIEEVRRLSARIRQTLFNQVEHYVHSVAQDQGSRSLAREAHRHLLRKGGISIACWNDCFRIPGLRARVAASQDATVFAVDARDHDLVSLLNDKMIQYHVRKSLLALDMDSGMMEGVGRYVGGPVVPLPGGNAMFGQAPGGNSGTEDIHMA